MLLIGLEPGAPGEIRWDGERVVPVPARGDAVRVTVGSREAPSSEADVSSWIQRATDGGVLRDDPSAGWVFAGSLFVERDGVESYAADDAGPIVGLATFGAVHVRHQSSEFFDRSAGPAQRDSRAAEAKSGPVLPCLCQALEPFSGSNW